MQDRQEQATTPLSFQDIFLDIEALFNNQDVERLAQEINSVLIKIIALNAFPGLNTDEKNEELENEKARILRRHLLPRGLRNTYVSCVTGFVAADLLTDSQSDRLGLFIFNVLAFAVCINGLDIWHFIQRTEARLQEMPEDEKNRSNPKK